MRITATTPAQATTRAKARHRNGDDGSFQLDAPSEQTPAAPLHGLDAPQSMDALLFLQDVGMPAGDKQRSARQGLSILDDLDQLKIGLLSGEISADVLSSLRGRLVANERSGDEGLDQLLDDVELRARVELAKLGHF